MESQLFDIYSDYLQQSPLNEPKIETEMCKKLIKGMVEAQSPLEQFERIGLGSLFGEMNL